MNVTAFLKRMPIFSSLTTAELNSFAPRIILQPFVKGEELCQEGKPGGRGLYILVSGQLNVYVKEQLLSTLYSGNYFGEVSLMTGEPHSATIRAVSNGHLLFMDRCLFGEICGQFPKILYWLSQVLGKKLRHTMSFAGEEKKQENVFVIIADEPKTAKSTLAVNLAASLAQQTKQKVLLVDIGFGPGSSGDLLQADTTVTIADLIRQNLPVTWPAIRNLIFDAGVGVDFLAIGRNQGDYEAASASLGELLITLKENYQIIVVDTPSWSEQNGSLTLLKSAGKIIYLVKDHPSREKFIRAKMEELKQQIPDVAAKLVVGIFLRGAELQTQLNIHCHFRLPYDQQVEDPQLIRGLPFINKKPNSLFSTAVARLAREIMEKKIGLALSAGMAAGMAHLGVLKVFQQEKIPVDVIAGTSGGALFGMAYAAGNNLIEIEKILRGLNRFSYFSLLDFTFPIRSFISGKKINQYIQSFIEDISFDELVIPMKVVAADYVSGDVFIIEQGSIREAIKASIAVPGIFPIQEYGDRLLVDGATVSPLPVDVLFRYGADRIMAVNACSDPAGDNRGKENSKTKQAHLFDIINHSRSITSYHLAEIESRRADLTIVPNINKFSWRDYHKSAEIIGEGERAAEKALPQIKELLSA